MSINQEKISVLVCGAGPTGLMAACQLALHSIKFRIIDKSSTATTQSRALVLHTRSMEIFKQMGIVDKALALGEICHGATWVFSGKEVANINIFGDNLTEFPYVLCLEQSKTEEILIDCLKKLGHTVERQVELVNYATNEQGIIATLKNADGMEEVVSADYLIGADGAHSIVREKMGFPMDGSTYLQTLFVIDCQVQADIRPKEIYITMSPKGLIGFFPMVQSHDKTQEGHYRYRVLGVLPASEKDKVITFDEVEKNFSERVGMPAKIYDAAWISTYHAHHRHAKAFREGRCFIVGDAAHIHSPVGGQGMNTGLQDAYNLVWKLALVIRGKAHDILLDTFNDERLTVAKKLVESTDKMFYLVAGESSLIKFFRLHILPWILRALNTVVRHSQRLSKAIFSVVSQIGVNYSHSLLSQNASWGNFLKETPQPGERFPFMTFEENGEKQNIQHYLQGTMFHLFIFSNHKDGQSIRLSPDIAPFQEIMMIHQIAYSPEMKKIWEILGLTESGYYLVRPDMYIACRSSSLDIEPLVAYLDRFFKK